MLGVDKLDRSMVDFYNASMLGEAIWDNNFDLSPAHNQKQVYDLCQDLKQQDDMLYEKGVIKCWLDDFKTFVEANGESFPI